MANPQPTFGRRHAPLPSQPRRPERDPLAFQVGLRRRPALDNSVLSVVVPNSVGAGVLVGTVVGVVSLALHMLDGASTPTLGPFALNLGSATTPVALLSALWAGGQAGVTAAYLVQAVLRRLQRTSYADYALAGAAIGLATSLLLRAIGLSADAQPWPVDLLTSALAGLTYRLFAGAIPRS